MKATTKRKKKTKPKNEATFSPASSLRLSITAKSSAGSPKKRPVLSSPSLTTPQRGPPSPIRVPLEVPHLTPSKSPTSSLSPSRGLPRSSARAVSSKASPSRTTTSRGSPVASGGSPLRASPSRPTTPGTHSSRASKVHSAYGSPRSPLPGSPSRLSQVGSSAPRTPSRNKTPTLKAGVTPTSPADGSRLGAQLRGFPPLSAIYHTDIPADRYDKAVRESSDFGANLSLDLRSVSHGEPSLPHGVSDPDRYWHIYDFVLKDIVMPLVNTALGIGSLVHRGKELQTEYERRLVEKSVFTTSMLDVVPLPDTVGEVLWDTILATTPKVGQVCAVGRDLHVVAPMLLPFQINIGVSTEEPMDARRQSAFSKELLKHKGAKVRGRPADDSTWPYLVPKKPNVATRLHSVVVDEVTSLTYTLSHDGSLVCYDGTLTSALHSANVFNKRDHRRILPSDELLYVDDISGLVFVNTTYENRQVQAFNMRIGRRVRTTRVKLPHVRLNLKSGSKGSLVSRYSQFSHGTGVSKFSAVSGATSAHSGVTFTSGLLTVQTQNSNKLQKFRMHRLSIYVALEDSQVIIGRSIPDSRVMAYDMRTGVPLVEFKGLSRNAPVLSLDSKSGCLFIAEGINPDELPSSIRRADIAIYVISTIQAIVAEVRSRKDLTEYENHASDDSDSDDNDEPASDDSDSETRRSRTASHVEKKFEFDDRNIYPSRVLKGHTGPITAVRYLHVAKLIVSSAYDGTLRFWDPTANPIQLTCESEIPSIRMAPGEFAVRGVEWTKTNHPFTCTLIIKTDGVCTGLRVMSLDGGQEGLSAIVSKQKPGNNSPRSSVDPDDEVQRVNVANYEAGEEDNEGVPIDLNTSPMDAVGNSRRLLWFLVSRVATMTPACEFDCPVSSSKISSCEEYARTSWITDFLSSRKVLRQKMKTDAVRVEELRAVDTQIFKSFRRAVFWRPTIYHGLTERFLRDVYFEWKRRSTSLGASGIDTDRMTLDSSLVLLRSACRMLLPSLNVSALYRRYYQVTHNLTDEEAEALMITDDSIDPQMVVRSRMFAELAAFCDPIGRLRDIYNQLRRMIIEFTITSGRSQGVERMSIEMEAVVRHSQLVRLGLNLMPIDAKLRLRVVSFRRDSLLHQIKRSEKSSDSRGVRFSSSLHTPRRRKKREEDITFHEGDMFDEDGRPITDATLQRPGILRTQGLARFSRATSEELSCKKTDGVKRLQETLPDVRVSVDFGTHIPQQEETKRMVYPGLTVVDKERVAVVVICGKYLSHIQQSGLPYEKHVATEVEYLYNMEDHTYFPKVYGIVSRPEGGSQTMGGAATGAMDDLMLVMDSCLDSIPVKDVIDRRGPLRGKEGDFVVREWGRHVLRALQQLHSTGAILRSLTTSSVLISFEGNRVTIPSLGYAMIRREVSQGASGVVGADLDSKMLQTTNPYVPPEVFHNTPSSLTPAYDIWTFGTFLSEIVSGADLPSYGKALQSRLDLAATGVGDIAFPRLNLDSVMTLQNDEGAKDRSKEAVVSPRTQHYMFDCYSSRMPATGGWLNDTQPHVPYSAVEGTSNYPEPIKDYDRPPIQPPKADPLRITENDEVELERISHLPQGFDTVENSGIILQDIISACLNTDPKQRPSVDLLLACSYFNPRSTSEASLWEQAVTECMHQADAALLVRKYITNPLSQVHIDLLERPAMFDVVRMEHIIKIVSFLVLPDPDTNDDARILTVSGFPIFPSVRKRIRDLVMSTGLFDGLVTIALRSMSCTGLDSPLVGIVQLYEGMLRCLREEDSLLEKYVPVITYNLLRMASGNERLGCDPSLICPRCTHLHSLSDSDKRRQRRAPFPPDYIPTENELRAVQTPDMKLDKICEAGPDGFRNLCRRPCRVAGVAGSENTHAPTRVAKLDPKLVVERHWTITLAEALNPLLVDTMWNGAARYPALQQFTIHSTAHHPQSLGGLLAHPSEDCESGDAMDKHVAYSLPRDFQMWRGHGYFAELPTIVENIHALYDSIRPTVRKQALSYFDDLFRTSDGWLLQAAVDFNLPFHMRRMLWDDNILVRQEALFAFFTLVQVTCEPVEDPVAAGGRGQRRTAGPWTQLAAAFEQRPTIDPFVSILTDTSLPPNLRCTAAEVISCVCRGGSEKIVTALLRCDVFSTLEKLLRRSHLPQELEKCILNVCKRIFAESDPTTIRLIQQARGLKAELLSHGVRVSTPLGLPDLVEIAKAVETNITTSSALNLLQNLRRFTEHPRYMLAYSSCSPEDRASLLASALLPLGTAWAQTWVSLSQVATVNDEIVEFVGGEVKVVARDSKKSAQNPWFSEGAPAILFGYLEIIAEVAGCGMWDSVRIADSKVMSPSVVRTWRQLSGRTRSFSAGSMLAAVVKDRRICGQKMLHATSITLLRDVWFSAVQVVAIVMQLKATSLVKQIFVEADLGTLLLNTTEDWRSYVTNCILEGPDVTKAKLVPRLHREVVVLRSLWRGVLTFGHHSQTALDGLARADVVFKLLQLLEDRTRIDVEGGMLPSSFAPYNHTFVIREEAILLIRMLLSHRTTPTGQALLAQLVDGIGRLNLIELERRRMWMWKDARLQASVVSLLRALAETAVPDIFRLISANDVVADISACRQKRSLSISSILYTRGAFPSPGDTGGDWLGSAFEECEKFVSSFEEARERVLRSKSDDASRGRPGEEVAADGQLSGGEKNVRATETIGSGRYLKRTHSQNLVDLL